MRGTDYYLGNLFDTDGLPRPFAKAPRLTVYKRELYDCAECINLCLLLEPLSRLAREGRGRGSRNPARLDQTGRLVSLPPTQVGLGQRADASLGAGADFPELVLLPAGAKPSISLAGLREKIGQRARQELADTRTNALVRLKRLLQPLQRGERADLFFECAADWRYPAYLLRAFREAGWTKIEVPQGAARCILENSSRGEFFSARVRIIPDGAKPDARFVVSRHPELIRADVVKHASGLRWITSRRKAARREL